jgi:hypothetical protein
MVSISVDMPVRFAGSCEMVDAMTHMGPLTSEMVAAVTEGKPSTRGLRLAGHWF